MKTFLDFTIAMCLNAFCLMTFFFNTNVECMPDYIKYPVLFGGFFAVGVFNGLIANEVVQWAYPVKRNDRQ